jgi:hypothetical protein
MEEAKLRPALIDYFEVGQLGALSALVNWWGSTLVDLPKLKHWLLANTPETYQGAVDEDDTSDEMADFKTLQKGMRLLHAGETPAKFYAEYLAPLLAEEDEEEVEEVEEFEEVEEDNGMGWQRQCWQ